MNINNFKETGVCILNDTFNAYHLKSNKDSMYPFIGNHDITKKTKYIKNFKDIFIVFETFCQTHDNSSLL